MNVPLLWQRGAQFCLSLSYLLLIPLSFLLYSSGFSIDTDIKKLSPNSIFNLELQKVLDSASKDAEKRMRFVFVSNSEDELIDALFEFEEQVELVFPNLEAVDYDSVLLGYKKFLLDNKPNFLTESDRLALSKQSENKILENGKRSAYELRSGFRITSLPEDPFGFLNNFIAERFERFSGNGSENQSSAVQIYKHSKFVDSIELELLAALSLSEQALLVSQLDKLRDEISSNYPSVSIYSSGVLFFAQEASQNSKRDISLISTVSMAGILLLLWSVFRSVGPVFLPFISIASGVFSAFVFSSWFFGSIHIITIVFGASLIGVVVDYALHYFYFLSSQKTLSSSSSVYKALALSLLTSVIGYAALSFSGLPALKQVAFFSIVGLVCSWLTVIAIGHCFISPKGNTHDTLLKMAVNIALRVFSFLSPRLLSILLLGVGVAFAFVCFQGLNVSDNPRSFFSFSQERIKQEQKAASLTASYEPASFVLVKATSIDGLYENIENVRQSLNEFPRLLGVDDFLPSREMQKQNYEVYQYLIKHDLDTSLLRDLGFNTENVQGKHESLNRPFYYVSPETLYSHGLSGVPELWGGSESEQFSLLLIPVGMDLELLKSKLNSLSNVELISTVGAAENALKTLRESAMVLLVFACVFISLLMYIRYRNPIKILMLLVPVTSILSTILIIQMLGQSLSLFHVMALFLVLGLGMDYVIFVGELSESTRETMIAIVLSALTSLLSFGLLSLSATPIIHSFGVAVLVGNTFNLLGSFVLASRSKSFRVS